MSHKKAKKKKSLNKLSIYKFSERQDKYIEILQDSVKMFIISLNGILKTLNQKLGVDKLLFVNYFFIYTTTEKY